MTAFERYAPFIQDYIYRKGWDSLRGVQVDACEAILDGGSHVLISSGTASGKTEAAFFPILTELSENPPKSVGVLYIGPLKALINDQFSRLELLLEEQDIPVFPWHGDISAHVKKKAISQARGIIQITPESLEGMVMSRAGEAKRLFGDLRFVVIDEIHAFMGSDRGLQILCLLERLQRMAGCHPRRVGLSATLHESEPALEFLTMGSDLGGVSVGLEQEKRTIQLISDSFFIPEEVVLAGEAWGNYYDKLYDLTHLKKCLIFTNSRGETEKTIAYLKEIAENRREKDVFYTHHGSVSAALRQEAETALRENQSPTVAAATLTLELGIDIGDLDFTVQVGAPFTCSSFVQRLGRSGRRSGVPRMVFFDVMEERNRDIFDVIPWNLLRSIAITQLYSEERWVEPFEMKAKPYSLLVHQTMSILMSYGSLLPSDLARMVLTLGIFLGKITQEEFRQILSHLISEDMIEVMETGELIVGLKGERMTNHFSFYAVFSEEESYRVRGKEGDIGTLDTCPMVDEVFVLAGKTWKVTAVEVAKKIIYVTLVKNRRVPSWRGSGAHIHRKVVERMGRILGEDVIYPYLKEGSVDSLEKARAYAREIDLLSQSYFRYGTNSFYYCPWVGTKELMTVKQLFAVGLKDVLGVRSVVGGLHYLQVTADCPVEEISTRVKEVCGDFHRPEWVLPEGMAPKIDKFDWFVPDDLLRKSFLFHEMMLEDAFALLVEGEKKK